MLSETFNAWTPHNYEVGMVVNLQGKLYRVVEINGNGNHIGGSKIDLEELNGLERAFLRLKEQERINSLEPKDRNFLEEIKQRWYKDPHTYLCDCKGCAAIQQDGTGVSRI